MNNKTQNLILGISGAIILTVGVFVLPANVQAAESSAPSIYTSYAADITQTSVTLRGGVDPNGASTTAWFEWGTSSNGLTNETSHQNMGNGTSYIDFLAGLANLSNNTTYYYRAVAQNAYGTSYGSTRSFDTTLNPSTVYTSYATNITSSSATIRGSVDPKGLATTARFQWGESSDGLTHETSHQNMGNGETSIDFLTGLTGLDEGRTYYYRAVAENSDGVSYGSTRSFITSGAAPSNGGGGGGGGGGSCLPIVTTKPASFITKDSASLRALVNPSGRSTSGWFEYGKSYALTLRTTTTHVGSGSVDTDLLRYLASLDPNATYYFRAIAENNCGKAQGSILSFTTEIGIQPSVVPTPSPAPTPTPSPLPTPPTSTPPIVKAFSLTKEIKNLTFPNGTVHINASFIGDTLEYYLNIKNNQATELKNILVKDIIDDHFEFIEADPKIDSSSSSNTLYWKIDSIKQGETKIITYRIKTKAVEESVVIPNVFKAEVNGVSRASNEATTILNPTLMSLDISADKNHVNCNEEFTYTIRYRNIGVADVDNTLLKVSLPAYIDLKDADKNYSDEGNVLFFNLGRVNKNEAGTIHINVQVNKDASKGESLVATAVLDFTDVFNDPQPNISASTVVVVESGFFGLSSAVGVLGRMDFWLWLILLLIAGFVFGIFYMRYKIAKIMKA